MSKNRLKILLSFVLIFGIFILSYIYFSIYQPKSLKKVEEVKGLSSINTDDVPYPMDAEIIGFSQTPKSSITTFKTSKTQSEVQEFYKNIYNSKKWKLVSERQSDGSLTISYQKEKETITIVVTQEAKADYTTVSVEENRK